MRQKFGRKGPLHDARIAATLSLSAPPGTVTGSGPVTLDANAETILSLNIQVIGLDTQAANTVWAGPASGDPAVPSFRALTVTDVSNLAYGTPSLTLTTANAEGSAETVMRTDASILVFDGTNPTSIESGDSAAVGSASVAARRDHQHAVTSSSNPGANEFLLHSTADGYLTLVRLGLGTTPSYPLEIYSATLNDLVRVSSGDNRAVIVLADDDTTNYIISEGSMLSLGGTASMCALNLNIDDAGRVMIGATTYNSSNAYLTVVGGIDASGHIWTQSRVYAMGVGSTPYATNSESIMMRHASDIAEIISIATGTGTLRDMRFYATSTAQDQVRLYTGGDVAMLAGNLGVGIATPSGILHLYTTTGSTYLYMSSDGVTSGTGIEVDLEGTSGQSMRFYTKADGGSTGERARITGAGNFGLGTASPLDILHLQGSSIGVGSDETVTADNIAVLIIEDTDAFIELYSDDVGSWGSGINLAEMASNALVDKWSLVRQTGTTGDASLRIVYGTNRNPWSNSTLITIATDGDVSIGTTSNSGQLHVDQSSESGNQPVLYLDQGDSDPVTYPLIRVSANGADADMTIMELAVTGSPSWAWDESEDSFVYSVTTAETNDIVEVLTLEQSTTGSPIGGLGTGILFKTEDQSGSPIDMGELAAMFGGTGTNTGVAAMMLSTYYAGSALGRWVVASAQNVAGNYVVLVADGTRDVTTAVYYVILVIPSTGDPDMGSGVLTPGAANATIYDDEAGNTLEINVNANGQIQVIRGDDADSYTYKVAGGFLYI
jgi:hypothetical protein